MDKKELEPNNNNDTPKKRTSRFSDRIEKKRSGLDRKLSRMKSKFDTSFKKANKDSADKAAEKETQKVEDQTVVKNNNQSPPAKVPESPPSKERASSKNKEDEIIAPKAKATDNTKKIDTNKFKRKNTELSNPVKALPDKALPAKDKPTLDKKTKASKPVKDTSAPSLKGFKAKGASAVKPSWLVQKIIDHLYEYNDINFVSLYRDQFKRILKNLPKQNLSISWVGESLPSELGSEHNYQILLKNGQEDLQLKQYIQSKLIRSVHALNWEGALSLSPDQIGTIRHDVDLHIINNLPNTNNAHKLIPLLERISRQSGALIIFPASLKQEVNALFNRHEVNRGYSITDDSQFCFIDNELLNSGLKWIDQFLSNEGIAESILPFCQHRQIALMAKKLELACDSESEKLIAIQDLENAISSEASEHFDLTKAEILVKGLLSTIKSNLGEGGVSIDNLGEVRLNTSISDTQAAQALVSNLSIDDLVREDELDLLKFNNEQRKQVNRMKRFRFASKLGFGWKIKPEYLDALHRDTLELVVERAITKYKKVSETVELFLADMATQKGTLKNNSSESSQFNKFLTVWRSNEHLTKALSKYVDLNHFRAALFAKKGGASPIEAQGGVMKELRESRMFVSQLMAFGMLAAILLGSSFAVDVLVNWFSGSSMNISEELTQASRDSRGLGRQVRILIAGVAGICIVFYLILRMYLKNAEKILDQQRVVSVYSQQLEEGVSKFISESMGLADNILNADVELVQAKYDAFKASLPDAMNTRTRGITDKEGVRQAGYGKENTIKQIMEVKKWLLGLLTKREGFSIVDAHQKSFSDIQKNLQE